MAIHSSLRTHDFSTSSHASPAVRTHRDEHVVTWLRAHKVPEPSFEQQESSTYEGGVLRAIGSLSEARALYVAARNGLANADVTTVITRLSIDLDLAILDLLEGKYREAFASIQSIRDALRRADEQNDFFELLLGHYAALASVATGVEPIAIDEPEPPADLHEERRRFIVETRALVRDIKRAPRSRATFERVRALEEGTPLWEHARLSVSILRGLLGGASNERDLLYVRRATATFELSSRPSSVELAKRPVLLRVIDALLEAHAYSRGRGLSTEELIRAAWPDERILPKAARNRLHVAISTLRTLGFDSVIERTRSGYALASRVEVMME